MSHTIDLFEPGELIWTSASGALAAWRVSTTGVERVSPVAALDALRAPLPIEAVRNLKPLGGYALGTSAPDVSGLKTRELIEEMEKRAAGDWMIQEADVDLAKAALASLRKLLARQLESTWEERK